MNQLTELLMYRALHFKQSNKTTTDAVLDHFVAENENSLGQLQLRNVCAKVSEDLAERLDEMCALLGISKRRFVESAIIVALNEADRVVTELDIFADHQPAEGGK
jgi:hypothetical protein